MIPASDRTESQPGYVRRIWLSMFPAPLPPRSERERTRFLLRNLILHFRPTLVPERTLRFSLTFGLGGMAAVLVVLQLFTGVLLKFVYEPFPTQAYESLIRLQGTFLFGRLIRNIHFWSANFLILVVFLHGLRVLFTGAFHAPRQMNWVIGLTLFLLVVASNLTGYLLPWDQLAYWATTICVGMLEYIPFIGTWLQRAILGGSQMGLPTLRNFYAFHTAVIPALIVALMAFHFWRVRKAGGLVIPRSPGEELIDKPITVSTVPHLLVREVTVALCLVAFVMVFSVVFDAPMGASANPASVRTRPRPRGTSQAFRRCSCTFTLRSRCLSCSGHLFMPYLVCLTSTIHKQQEASGSVPSSAAGPRWFPFALVRSVRFL